MNEEQIWNYDEPVADLDIWVPEWIDDDITGTDVASIVQGGCASGAYMPAVTYHQAMKTMLDHGDDVLEYIENHLEELPQPERGESWSGMACFYLSYAVELWAMNAHTLMEDLEHA